MHYVAKVDKNGYVSLKITLLPKKYTMAAEYKGFKTSNKLVVKQTLKVVKKTIKVKKGKKITIKATLKWANGKVIKFKFKGKPYKVKVTYSVKHKFGNGYQTVNNVVKCKVKIKK